MQLNLKYINKNISSIKLKQKYIIKVNIIT